MLDATEICAMTGARIDQPGECLRMPGQEWRWRSLTRRVPQSLGAPRNRSCLSPAHPGPLRGPSRGSPRSAQVAKAPEAEAVAPLPVLLSRWALRCYPLSFAKPSARNLDEHVYIYIYYRVIFYRLFQLKVLRAPPARGSCHWQTLFRPAPHAFLLATSTGAFNPPKGFRVSGLGFWLGFRV